MRNLKRALSLTLASVMLLGMMVVGAGAAGYKDITDDHNVEAIEVLQAVGAMVGDEAGNFDPDANVNRAQIATIMSRLLDLKVEDFNAADIPFTDVPEWAVPFVAACYADGITSGVSATAFGSSNNVTAAQAALMMMKALGYFQYQDDFGDDWQLATIKQASEIGLFYGVTVDRTSPLTRNDVAQMALNALKSNMVAFTGEVGSVYEVNGASIRVGYKPEYTIKTSADPIYDRIDNLATTIDKPTGQYEMQLGEYLYGGDLRLTSTTDVFGRPSRYWEFNGEEIGTYVKEELLRQSYTTSVTGKALYDLLGSATLKDYELNVTIDGESDPEVFGGFTNSNTGKQDYYTIFNATHLNRNNDANVGGTGNGVLTQVFVDTNDKTVYIAVINTYLAKADDDYNEKKEQVGLDVYDIREPKGYKNTYIKDTGDKNNKYLGYSENIVVTAEEFDIADVAKGDFFLVTVADGAIQSMRTPDVLSAVEISSFSKGSSLTTDGTKYDYADTLRYDSKTLELWTDGDNKVNLKDLTYNVYLDQYGYAIGVKESEAPKNYVFITGVNGDYNNLVNINLEANAIFMDGTMDTIRINGRKSDFESAHEKLDLSVDNGATVNRWFTYTKSSSGIYNVKLVDYGVNSATGQFHEDRDGIVAQDTIDYKKHNVMVNRDKDLYDPEIMTSKDANHVVYSNDDTVFLTVGLDNLHTSANHYAAVISDVESVSVGIDNVDITPWNHDFVKNMSEFDAPHGVVVKDNGKVDTVCDHSYGVYALYNSDGYIIAMVVVGQDNGTNDNLVYVDSGDVKSESYDKATEKWTWVRNAIVNGERVELVEVNDTGISLLEKMDKWNWYRVRYNAEGHVTGVSAHNKHDTSCKSIIDKDCLDFDLDYKDNWRLNDAPYAYVTNYKSWKGLTDGIYSAINASGVNVVLYHEEFFNVHPENSGHTLYMTTKDKEASGVRYTEDTNVVFIQAERNKWTTEWWKGQSGVEKAIKALHELDKYNDNKSYEISVTWKDGRATAIIIRDLNVQGQDGEWGNVRTGNVYFDATDSLDWAARMLAIYNEKADITDQGRGRFYFELTGINDFDIHDGSNGDTILYRYKVYVNEEKANNQVGREQTGTLYPIAGEPNHYWAEVPELPHTFNVDEELFIVITEVLNGVPNMPVDTDGTMPGNMGTPKFETPEDAANAGGSLGNAYPGQGLTVTIPTVPAGRAVGDRVEGDLAAETPYYVEINGNKADPDPVYLVNGALKVTYTITVADITKGELVITGIYESEAEGTETDPKPPVDQPIKTVTVTGLPTGTIKAGDKFTVKTTTANVSGSVDVTAKAPTTEITLKITTTHEAGFAKNLAAEGWTVEVAENGKSATLTKTVDVEPADTTTGDFTVELTEGTEYDFVVTYEGDKPTDVDAVVAEINKLLPAEETKVASWYAADGTLYDTKDAPMGTVKFVGTFKLFVNGSEIAGVTLTNADTAQNATVTLPATVSDKLIKKGENNVAAGSAVSVTDDMGTKKITISAADQKALTGDLYLVNAYELATLDSTISGVKYEADGAYTAATASNLFADGTKFEITGKKTDGDGDKITLTMGEYTKTIAAEAAAHKWEVTFDAATMLDASAGTILPKEGVTNELKVVVEGVGEWNLTSSTAFTNPITLTAQRKMPEAGSYVAKKADGTWDSDSDNLYTAVAAANNTVTLTNSGALNIVDGVLTLQKAVKVTVGSGIQDVKFGDGAGQQPSEGDVLYTVAGTKITVGTSDPAATDRLVVKNADGETVAIVVGKYPVLDDATIVKAGADLTISMETAAADLELTAVDLAVDSIPVVTGILGSVTDLELNPTNGNVAHDGTAKTITFEVKAADGFYIPEGIKVTAGQATTGKYPMSNIETSLENGILTITFTYGEKAS